MSITHAMAKKLTRFPKLKRILRNTYSYIGNILSDKKTELPGLIQVSSDDSEHNFGYYDKSPWSRDQQYMIYLAPRDASRHFVSKEPTPIILYDCRTGNETVLSYTHTWNSQQGCMLQWLGPDFSTRILYNDFRNGQYCSVIYSLRDKTERVLQMPVYTVSTDGKKAITLDFSRLNTFRPGYGYCNLKDETARERCPDAPCMWRLDIENNTAAPLPVRYTDLARLKPQDSMRAGYHKINHIMLNPSGSRFMFIHRWIVNGMTHHRLLTCSVDGSDLYVLLDDGMVSHNNWKDDETIISYSYSRRDGDGYHILHDKTQRRELIGAGILTTDGHPSYSPDGKYIITDTYPYFNRKQYLYLIRVEDGKIRKLGSIYSNFKYRNEVRCDLHPRWNHDSTKICFDGTPGTKRQVYVFQLNVFFSHD